MKRRREEGFTLLELVMAMAVAGILLPLLSGLFFSGTIEPARRSANLAAFKDLNLTSHWLSQDLGSGPSGNNLSPSASRPPYASVYIGSSPGFAGNNSITIVYNTWDTPGSTTTTQRTITYALERPDPSSSEIQLVRTDDSGQKQVMAFHIADPSHVVFSGSTISNQAGGPSPGITLNITSTVHAAFEPISRSAVFEYSLPRTYQPLPTPPPPAPMVWNVILPSYLPERSGYWYVITTAGEGNISLEWTISGAASLHLYIYSGQPMGVPSGDSTTTPSKVEATIVASNSATTNALTVTSFDSQPAGTYTVYFFNNSTTSYVNTTAATVTYVSPGHELAW